MFGKSSTVSTPKDTSFLFSSSNQGDSETCVWRLIGKQFEAAKHACALMKMQMSEADKIAKLSLSRFK